MKRILIPLLILALLCIGTAGMAEGNSMLFDKSANTVFEGETLQTILNREGEPAGGTVSYQSSAPKIMTVDENGVVTGVKKGQATLTATVQGEKRAYTARLQINVAKKAETIEITNADKLPVYTAEDPLLEGLLEKRESEEENALPVLLIPIKKTVTVNSTVMPKDATNRKIVTACEPDGLIKVNLKDLTGKTAGEGILTLANELSPEVRTTYRVLVIQPATRITLAASAANVAVGETVQLTANIEPEDAPIRGVVWSSGDEKIATVDENGVVTGIKRGNARIVATAKDGSNVRANISVKVVQKAEGVTLDKPEVTVDAGKNVLLKATITPTNTDDRSVTWTSSDESIATVNAQGRVSGLKLGDCQITCTSNSNGAVQAVAVVHVQQPVTKITFDPAPEIYVGESGKLTWTVEPADASNPAVKLTSTNKSVLSVDEDGTIHGLKHGETYVDAISTDGSNRKARLKIKVMQHVEGVSMIRQAAYIDVKESAHAGATIIPKTADNQLMTWESDDPSIVKVVADAKKAGVTLTGLSLGKTTVRGTTVDGGFETSLKVHVGDFDHGLTIVSGKVDKYGWLTLRVRNDLEYPVNGIKVLVSVWDNRDHPVDVNTKDGSNGVDYVYNKTLQPGEITKDAYWTVDYFNPVTEPNVDYYEAEIRSYQIDHDWVKTVRRHDKYNRKKFPVTFY